LYNDLKDLHFEIQFADAIKEDSTGLKTDFDTKLLEYNALKNNGYGNNF
jgi:hypothetical protein